MIVHRQCLSKQLLYYTCVLTQWSAISDGKTRIRFFISNVVNTETVWRITLLLLKTSVRLTSWYHSMRVITNYSTLILSLTFWEVLERRSYKERRTSFTIKLDSSFYWLFTNTVSSYLNDIGCDIHFLQDNTWAARCSIECVYSWAPKKVKVILHVGNRGIAHYSNSCFRS